MTARSCGFDSHLRHFLQTDISVRFATLATFGTQPTKVHAEADFRSGATRRLVFCRGTAFAPEFHVSRLPRSNTRAIWALALFAAVQCADALQTAHGIQRFGYSIEANPILSAYLFVLGPGATLIGAKAVALSAGLALYHFERYASLVALTVLVVFSALVPWALVLR